MLQKNLNFTKNAWAHERFGLTIVNQFLNNIAVIIESKKLKSDEMIKFKRFFELLKPMSFQF